MSDVTTAAVNPLGAIAPEVLLMNGPSFVGAG